MEENKLLSYLEREKQHAIFLTKEEFEAIINGPYIVINNAHIYFDIMVNILENQEYYQKVCRFFEGQEPTFYVAYIENGDIARSLRYSKIEILESLNQMIKFGHIVLSSDIKKRYQYLKGLLSYDTYKEKQRTNFEVTIDTIMYVFKTSDFFDFLELPDDEYKELSKSPDRKTIYGVPRVHFFYALNEFLKVTNCLSDYMITSNIRDRCREISNYKYVDYEAVNKYLETKDTMYKKAVLSDNLRKKVLQGMPTSFDTLERAIYIYIKLCKILTYDEEYYAVNEKGEATKKHKDVNYVSTIDENNNEVVCFEFNLIYTKFLSELGVNFESVYRGMAEESYGDAHASCHFRIGKFLLEADSTYSILNGDFLKAKLNKPLGGILSLNRSNQTRSLFEKKLANVYAYIIKNEEVDDLEFQELLDEYLKTTTNYQAIPLLKRLDILMKILESTTLQGIDSYSYILELKRILFSKEEQNNKIKVNIIRNNEVEDKVANLVAVISLNEEGFKDNLEATSYYCFTPERGLVEVSYSELASKFQEGSLEYITDIDAKIPGIQEGVSK